MFDERSERRNDWFERTGRLRFLTTLYIGDEQKSISECTSPYVKADGLQQEKTTACSCNVSHEQESEATAGTGSPKVDSLGLI